MRCERMLINYQRRAPEEYDSGQASSNYEAQLEQGTRHDEDNGMTPTLLGPGEFLQGTYFQLKSKLGGCSRSQCAEFGVEACPRLPRIELTSSEVTRWKMASRLLESSQRADVEEAGWGTSIHQRCKDWPNVGRMFHLPIALGFTVAALSYGGLHALAWSAHFGSSTEQLLWRMSACVVMGGLPSCYVMIKFARYDGALHGRVEVIHAINVTITVLVGLIMLAYMPARAYLVVESFINLSHLPAGAYELPRWSTYFPHFS